LPRWITKSGRRIPIRGGRGAPRVARTSTKNSSFAGVKRRFPLNFPTPDYLVKVKLPVQQNLTDRVKGEAVEEVRKRWGDEAAAAAAAVIDQAVARAFPLALPTVTAQARVKGAGVRGSAATAVASRSLQLVSAWILADTMQPSQQRSPLVRF
jgi:hypothetical protein